LATDLMEYQARLWSANKPYIASTDPGSIGIFPPLVEVGDFVCVLGDYYTPVVLRKSGDNYLFVGPCYVPGLREIDTTTPNLPNEQGRIEEVRIL
jgi:hypothetical protein